MAAGIGLQLPLPLVMRELVDRILPSKDLRALGLTMVALTLIMAVKGALDVAHAYLLLTARERVTLSCQGFLLRHLYGLDLDFFRRRTSNEVTAWVNNDVASVSSGLLSNGIVGLVRDGGTVMVGTVMVVALDWRLACLSLLLLPLFVVSVRACSRRVREASGEYQRAFANVWESLQEPFSTMLLVKAYQTERYEERRFVAAARDRIGAMTRLNIISSISAGSTAFVAGLAPLVVLWYGGWEVVGGRLTLGTLLAFNLFVGYLFGPVQRLMSLNTDVQGALAALERLLAVLGEGPCVRDPATPANPPEGAIAIEFRNVSFAYEDGHVVVQDVTLSVAAGETVAVVGRSGAGKSTLVNLLLRLYDPTGGTIAINGVDLREMRQTDVRRLIALVPQEVLLIRGTVRENIAYGADQATEQEIEQAARRANASAFIEGMPDGSATQVGERGVLISGGERQRVAIARALLRDRAVLVLDEATAEVDSESERLIQRAVEEGRAGRTTIIIAHRFGSVLSADKIVVLDQGRVVAQGTHEALYSTCRVYRELCLNQFIGEGARSLRHRSGGYARAPITS